MNIQSRPTLKKKYISLLAVLLIAMSYSCKTVEREIQGLSAKNSFMVTRVKKLSREVYAIYALRNDTTFKIVSFYNGRRQANSRKLRKGDSFQAHLYSQFKALEDKFNIIEPCNVVIDFHGVAIGKELEHGIDDVWICKELNGPYFYELGEFDSLNTERP